MDNSALRAILQLTRHGDQNRLAIQWVVDAVPDDFVFIGEIEPTNRETEIDCRFISVWENFRQYALDQWRWVHDREAFLAEEAIKEKKRVEQEESEWKDRAELLANVVLSDFEGYQFFSTWNTYPPEDMKRASQKIMADTVKVLGILGPNSPESDRMAVSRQSVESFNTLDTETYWIETVEREDICAEFELIAHACGLGQIGDDELTGRWRNW